MRRWPRRLAWGAAALALLVVVASRWPPLRHPLDALRLARALSGPGGGGAAVRRIGARTEAGPLDLYLPSLLPGPSIPPGPSPPAGRAAPPGPPGGAAGARGCILLAHGMTDRGRRDPRLAAFARALARLGFAAAVPELPGMRRFRPEEGDIGRIASAFVWLARRHARPGRRCALMAFSFATGPALRAAARDALRPRVAAFIAAGGYYDLKAVLRHLTTSGRGERPAFPGGPPVRLGKWLFLFHNADLLGLGGHMDAVRAIARRKLADERANIGPWLRRLPEEGRTLLALLENADPARFEALYAAQPARLRAALEGWSLRDVVPRTRAPLYLLHGRGDPFVPPSESARLARRARERPGRRVRLLVLESFAHVAPGAGTFTFSGAVEGARLLGFISEVLTAVEEG